MIIQMKGDIFDADAEAIVIPVNTVGTMGKGLAKQAALMFPFCVGRYKKLCKTTLGIPGQAEVISSPAASLLMIGFTTKDHWRDPSQLSWIRSGMRALVEVVRREKIKSCAVPALGCGNGGLDPADAMYTIIAGLQAAPEICWLLYGPDSSP